MAFHTPAYGILAIVAITDAIIFKVSPMLNNIAVPVNAFLALDVSNLVAAIRPISSIINTDNAVIEDHKLVASIFDNSAIHTVKDLIVADIAISIKDDLNDDLPTNLMAAIRPTISIMINVRAVNDLVKPIMLILLMVIKH